MNYDIHKPQILISLAIFVLTVAAFVFGGLTADPDNLQALGAEMLFRNFLLCQILLHVSIWIVFERGVWFKTIGVVLLIPGILWWVTSGLAFPTLGFNPIP